MMGRWQDCNACNSHSNGECSRYLSRSGEQCVLQCSDAGIHMPQGWVYQSIGGRCVCEENWYGQNCDQSLVSDDGNGLPLMRSQTCGYDEYRSIATTHWIGDF